MKVKKSNFGDSKNYDVQLRIMNVGRRSISFVNVLVRDKNGKRNSTPINSDGKIVIPENDCSSVSIEKGHPCRVWNSTEDLNNCQFFVEDASGRNHRSR